MTMIWNWQCTNLLCSNDTIPRNMAVALSQIPYFNAMPVYGKNNYHYITLLWLKQLLQQEVWHYFKTYSAVFIFEAIVHRIKNLSFLQSFVCLVWLTVYSFSCIAHCAWHHIGKYTLQIHCSLIPLCLLYFSA